ncbi:MAG TPA: hypothetical protein VFS33_00520 [Gemmatimonadales bacterium]|nr:hypothetical protein [Gemmatimonadales bacterium]
MDWFVVAFVRASVVWLASGVSLGAAMALAPRLVVYRPTHFHMNLLGFVAMMIFGVAYHVLPRFAGRPLHAPRLAAAHWWLANAGLGSMVLGFALRPNGVEPLGSAVLGLGGLLSTVGAYAFAWNVWRTLGRAPGKATPAPARPPAAPLAHRRPLPVVGE